jgi:MoaA/NifB/PqqE/SkfB family radical SAM enzyme
MSLATTIIGRHASLLTHRIYSLPILVLMPHSRCNCRCVMCDIWKANQDRRELTTEDLAPHVESMRRLGVRRIVLSGGEALMHANLWALCEQLDAIGAKLTLLSTGLLLERHADNVARWCDEVIVSLDGPREIHDGIRGIPKAFDRLAGGVAALRERRAGLRISGRCVVQRRNYLALPEIVGAARAIGLDQISFLAADVSTEAFNRPVAWDGERRADVALSLAEARQLAAIVDDMAVSLADEFHSRFIAEDPAKLRRVAEYYLALNGEGEYPSVTCNAPWVSAVVEPNGSVRPCFFHRSFGNVHDQPLETILNSPAAVAFRRTLDVKRNEICHKCVCTLNLSPRAAV